MQLKNFYQLSFVLLLAITLTACTGSKKKTPSGNNNEGEDGGETDKILCEEYPTSEYCKMISENIQIKIEDAKPIQKHWESKEILYWSDPLYSKGFQYKNTEFASTGFSVDTGSSLKVGDKYIHLFYSGSDGSRLSSTNSMSISSTLGGSNGQILSPYNVGDKIISIALFTNKTYLVLPPIEIVA